MLISSKTLYIGNVKRLPPKGGVVRPTPFLPPEHALLRRPSIHFNVVGKSKHHVYHILNHMSLI